MAKAILRRKSLTLNGETAIMYSMTERKHSLIPITIVLPVALALAGFFAFLMTPAGRPIWLSAYPVLIWFNVDHAFPAETDIALGTVSGPDVLVPPPPHLLVNHGPGNPRQHILF